MTNEQLAEAVVMMKGGRKADDTVDPIFGLREESHNFGQKQEEGGGKGRGGGVRESGGGDGDRKGAGRQFGAASGIKGGSINAIETETEAVKGFDIGDHRYLLRTYPNTFVGSEAVTWMCDHMGVTEEDAVKLGQVCLFEMFLFV